MASFRPALTEAPAAHNQAALGTARSIPSRALASSVLDSPYQGSRTGLTPPISTSVPSTLDYGSFLRNLPTSNPARAVRLYPGWGILVIGSEENPVIRPTALLLQRDKAAVVAVSRPCARGQPITLPLVTASLTAGRVGRSQLRCDAPSRSMPAASCQGSIAQ